MTAIIGSTDKNIRFELYIEKEKAGELNMERAVYTKFIQLLNVKFGANKMPVPKKVNNTNISTKEALNPQNLAN